MSKKNTKRNTSIGKGRYADKWRIPDELWERMEPLLPPRKPHPLGCHNPRVPDRKAMDAIFFVLRTGCQWNALNATGICSSSSAHRRFQEWTEAGVFELIWALGLDEYEELKGIDWSWQSMDGGRVAEDGTIHFAGHTSSTDLPTTPEAPQGVFGGGAAQSWDW